MKCAFSKVANMTWAEGTSHQTRFALLNHYGCLVDRQNHLGNTTYLEMCIYAEWDLFQFGLNIILVFARMCLFCPTFWSC